MSKYTILVNILDRIRDEAATTRYVSRYNPAPGDCDKVNQARARAFIHLYLKVNFGLVDFSAREHFITDGTYDGGIDGYYIDIEARKIFFIQSKFRTTEANFETKKISLEEILVMDIDRITSGETTDENGNDYNGKIQGMIREISEISDIGRYSYHVVILANLGDWSPERMRKLTGGFSALVLDHEHAYDKLVFPVVAGTYFKASDLVIYVELSNKSAGSKISYTVQTQHHECEITVLFVPIAEVARLMNRYKNSILKYNPRSYLELYGAKVNAAIRQTIVSTAGNEFALLNNGITILSDETSINERIGQRNKAQLHLRNPQIINGGQTAYTLSTVFEECVANGTLDFFENKEVLVKVITLTSAEAEDAEKLNLIEQISTATNQQTAVTNADRKSNERIHLEIQKLIFERYGLLYERKTGEFSDGRQNGYITTDQVIDRNLFLRIYLTISGDFNHKAFRKAFARYPHFERIPKDLLALDKFYWGYRCYIELRKKDQRAAGRSAQRLLLGKVYAAVLTTLPGNVLDPSWT